MPQGDKGQAKVRVARCSRLSNTTPTIVSPILQRLSGLPLELKTDIVLPDVLLDVGSKYSTVVDQIGDACAIVSSTAFHSCAEVLITGDCRSLKKSIHINIDFLSKNS